MFFQWPPIAVSKDFLYLKYFVLLHTEGADYRDRNPLSDALQFIYSTWEVINADHLESNPNGSQVGQIDCSSWSWANIYI